MTNHTIDRPLNLFEIGDGTEWCLAHDKRDAYPAAGWSNAADHFRDRPDSVVAIDMDESWSMMWDLSERSNPNGSPLPDGFREVATIMKLDKPLGDGWDHRVTAKVRDWCRFFPRGPLASIHY